MTIRIGEGWEKNKTRFYSFDNSTSYFSFLLFSFSRPSHDSATEFHQDSKDVYLCVRGNPILNSSRYYF